MNRWFKYSMAFLLLTALGFLVALTMTNWGLSLTLLFASIFIPGQLSIAQMDGDLLGPMHFEDIEYRHASVHVAIKQLKLDWQPRSLLAGELNVTTLTASNLQIVLQPHSHKPDEEKSAGIDTLVLPLEIFVENANIDKIQFSSDSQQPPVQVDAVNFSMRAVKDKLLIKQFMLTAYNGDAAATGTIILKDSLPLTLKTELNYAFNKDTHLNSVGTVEGDLHELKLHQKITGLAIAEMKATGFDLVDALRWESSLRVENFNLANINAQFPPVLVVGDISANGDLDHLNLESRLQVEEKSIGQGNLQLEGKAELANLDYQFSVQGDFIGIDWPQGSVQIAGRGNLHSLDLADVQMQVLNGTITGHGRMQWAPDLLLDADLEARAIDTAGLSRQWPGKLNAQLALQTDARSDKRLYTLAVSKLTGDLRGYPLHGQGQASWDTHRITIDKLNVAVARSVLDIKGAIANKWDLRFSANSPDLRQLLPEAEGQFELSGKLAGTREEPNLSLTGLAKDVVYGHEGVQSVAVQIQTGLAAAAPLNIDIIAKGIVSRFGQWRDLAVTTTGINQSHSIALNLDNDTSHYATRLQGSFLPWQWTGNMTLLDVMPEQDWQWTLKQPVAVTIKQDVFQLSELCLRYELSELCAELDWRKDKHLASLNGVSVPMLLTKFWLPQNILLTGQFDIKSQLQDAGHGQYRGHLAITAADKAISANFVDLNETIILAESHVNVSLDEKSLRAKVRLPLSEGGGIYSEVNLEKWSMQTPIARNQAVDAKLKINNIPADTITRFIPDMARAQGNLLADLSVSGTLGEPQLRGTVQWREGNMIIPDLGISIADIQAELHSKLNNKIEYQIKARSGEGSVALNGNTTLDRAQGWPTQINMQSDRLEVINIPEAYILIDSDINVALQGNTINIDGDINVPRARLRPRAIPAGSEQLSRDVIVVDEQQDLAAARWLVSSRVRVKLGELVDFDGFGVSGKLKGNLLLIDEPDKLARGQGVVSIEEGIYRLRGQDLSIRRGRLIFADTFIDDPGVDVDAVRTIETVTVGVKLTGTLRQPQLTIFSEPVMSESDALSYLILGHSSATSTTSETESMRNNAAAMGFVAGDILSQEIGGRLGLDEMRVDVGDTAENTALVMGKYLSPKLYVRYFSGLIESSNIVQLRYQLSDRVQIQTEGGYRGSQSITGGDIVFTIEY